MFIHQTLANEHHHFKNSTHRHCMVPVATTSLLYNVDTPLPHLEARWFTSRNGLEQSAIRIHLNSTYVLPPEQSNDVYIMEWAVRHSEPSTKAILILNYCRLYLHATTISKLFDKTGSKILPHMYECTRPTLRIATAWCQWQPPHFYTTSTPHSHIWKPDGSLHATDLNNLRSGYI